MRFRFSTIPNLERYEQLLLTASLGLSGEMLPMI